MARYSTEFRHRVVAEILPPKSRSVEDVCRQFGISSWSIYRWKREVASGSMDQVALRPSERPLAEKLTLLLEGTALPEDQRGEWLRARGLHSEHLSLYEQELRESMTEKEKRQRAEIERLRKEKKTLERELRRKDAALAELAALVALKKKLSAIFDEEDEGA
jgi:transposase